MALSILVIKVTQITKSHYRIVRQGKIFKVKVFEVIQKFLISVKTFSLKIFRLYGT